MSNFTTALLVGKPTQAKLFSRNPSQRPHYHILVETENQQFDIAVNIASEDPKSADVRVLYALKPNITPPQVEALLSLSNGMFNLPAKGIVGIDFVRDQLVTKEQMQLLPLFNSSQPIEDQGEPQIKQLVEQVIAEKNAVLYAFGHRYEQRSAQQTTSNQAWGFQPDDGIHNIHMNQGNSRGNHDDENGRGEDGALFIYLRDSNTWVGVYVAFQTQSFDNDSHGYPLDDSQHTTDISNPQNPSPHRHHHHNQQQSP